MRTTTLVAVMFASLVVACFVDRPSEDLACSSNADCDATFTDNRQCTGGYCVVPNCPSDCTSCDEAAHTCQVDCTSADDCGGTITCPDGWDCTVNCVGGGACGDVECNSGSRCSIKCEGDNACGDIRCASACKCDVESPDGTSDSLSCPTVGNGGNQVRCTGDGTAGSECDSTVDSRCTKC